MLCIITDPLFKNDAICMHKVSLLRRLCQKKRIICREASSLIEAAELLKQNGGSAVLFAATSKFAFQTIKLNLRYGVNLIIADCNRLPEYRSVFSSVSYDWLTTLSEIFTYLEEYNIQNVAVFGINRSLENHVLIANTIVEYMPWLQCNGEQVFPLYDTLDMCFRSFFRHIYSFEAVICPNDMIAVYLINRLKKNDESLLKKLFIISLESSMLGKYYPISVTSFSDRNYIMAQKILEIHMHSGKGDGVAGHYSIRHELKIGASTRMKPFNRKKLLFPSTIGSFEKPVITFDNPIIHITADEDFQNLQNIEHLLQICSAYEFRMLADILKFNSYEEIAEDMGISVDSVKYYTRKLFNSVKLKSRVKLKASFSEYLSADDILRQNI